MTIKEDENKVIFRIGMYFSLATASVGIIIYQLLNILEFSYMTLFYSWLTINIIIWAMLLKTMWSK